MMKYLSNIFFKYLVKKAHQLGCFANNAARVSGWAPCAATTSTPRRQWVLISRCFVATHAPPHPVLADRLDGLAALKCYKKVFDPVKEKVCRMLELAHKEREGDSIDHLLLKSVHANLRRPGPQRDKDTAAESEVQSEITLQCYQQDFEKFFIEETHQYYREGLEWTDSDSSTT